MLTDVGLLAEAGAPVCLDPAARLLALEDIEERARHRGRLVWLLAQEVASLTQQLREIREELDGAGYPRLAADDLEALQVALGDAADAREARDAREVLDSHCCLAGAATLADGLREALEAMTEVEEITAILDEHELTDYYQSLPELVRHLAAAARRANRCGASSPSRDCWTTSQTSPRRCTPRSRGPSSSPAACANWRRSSVSMPGAVTATSASVGGA